jgi:hypothetical protein
MKILGKSWENEGKPWKTTDQWRFRAEIIEVNGENSTRLDYQRVSQARD